jgi:imidazoleglycerol-phosphate dehydratase
MERKAKVKRKTLETEIELDLNIDGSGNYDIATSSPFFDHMLASAARHGYFDIIIKAKGDTEVDFHHTVEDIGICMGEGLKKALGDKSGIKRYGGMTIPMSEVLASVFMDICDRSFLVYNVQLKKEKVGEFDIELVNEFFQAFVNHSGVTLHINLLHGNNAHHIIEAIFKAFGRALDEATTLEKRERGIASTKGVL